MKSSAKKVTLRGIEEVLSAAEKGDLYSPEKEIYIAKKDEDVFVWTGIKEMYTIPAVQGIRKDSYLGERGKLLREYKNIDSLDGEWYFSEEWVYSFDKNTFLLDETVCFVPQKGQINPCKECCSIADGFVCNPCLTCRLGILVDHVFAKEYGKPAPEIKPDGCDYDPCYQCEKDCSKCNLNRLENLISERIEK